VLVDYLRHTAAARVTDQQGRCDPATTDAAAALLVLAMRIERDVDFSAATAALVPTVPCIDKLHRISSKVQYGQRKVRQLLLQEPAVRDFCGCCKREAQAATAVTNTATATIASDAAAPLLCMQQLEQWSTQELSECCSDGAAAAVHPLCDHHCSSTSGKLLVQASNVGDLQEVWLDDLADNFGPSKSAEPCDCATSCNDSSSASNSTSSSNSSSGDASRCSSGKTGSNSSSNSSNSSSTSTGTSDCSSSGKSSRMQILWPTTEVARAVFGAHVHSLCHNNLNMPCHAGKASYTEQHGPPAVQYPVQPHLQPLLHQWKGRFLSATEQQQCELQRTVQQQQREVRQQQWQQYVIQQQQQQQQQQFEKQQQPQQQQQQQQQQQYEMMRQQYDMQQQRDITLCDRSKVLPHLKTYCCYQLCSRSNSSSSSSDSNTDNCDSGDDAAAEQSVQYAWFLLSSANLSSCALGSEMAFLPEEYKCGSFEMGVMFLPSRLAAPDATRGFSCDRGGPLDVSHTASLYLYRHKLLNLLLPVEMLYIVRYISC
jgi:Tyrosyl-DNA phosphodiesterase